jgi:hypothetical protein
VLWIPFEKKQSSANLRIDTDAYLSDVIIIMVITTLTITKISNFRFRGLTASMLKVIQRFNKHCISHLHVGQKVYGDLDMMVLICEAEEHSIRYSMPAL